MSEFKTQTPKQFATLTVINRFTISFDNGMVNDSIHPSKKINDAIQSCDNEDFKRTLSLVAEEVKKMEFSMQNHKETLSKIASSVAMTCEYYPCGSCIDDSAAVCCYYDTESPPVCVCESC